MEDIKKDTKQDNTVYLEFVKAYANLTYIKNLIRDKAEVENGQVKIKSLFFTDELLNLIKYTDKEFYNELKQQGAEQ